MGFIIFTLYIQHLREDVISLNNDSNETSRKIEVCKMDEQECKTLLEYVLKRNFNILSYKLIMV